MVASASDGRAMIMVSSQEPTATSTYSFSSYSSEVSSSISSVSASQASCPPSQQQYVETEEMWFPNWDMGSAPWKKVADGQVQKVFTTSPHLYVDKWDTPILCIHGQKDFRIEYTHAESAFNTARMRGIDAQLLLFPPAKYNNR